MEAAFFRRIKGISNGWQVVTPNGDPVGKGLSHRQIVAKWYATPRKDRLRLEDLGAYDPAKAPTPPKGGVVLRVFSRPLKRDGDLLSPYRQMRGHISREANRDFLWLTAAEAKSLVPADPTKGARAAVPREIVDRICRRYLIDVVRIGGNMGPRHPTAVREQQLHLTVEEVTASRVRLRLDGKARYWTLGDNLGAPKPDGREDSYLLWGRLEYDRKAAAFTRFDLAALSETGHYDEVGKKITAMGLAFELTDAKAPADRVRPSSYYQNYYGAKK